MLWVFGGDFQRLRVHYSKSNEHQQLKSMRTYFLYYSATASANDAAHIDIKGNGTIVGIDWAIYPTAAVATGDQLVAELSFNSTAQASNDAANMVSVMAAAGFLTTSGACVSALNKWAGPMAIPVRLGDRICLNITESGASTWVIRAIVHVR